jgi:tRNA threonylcarbamoyladenosine biosynthesis protein TsaE
MAAPAPRFQRIALDLPDEAATAALARRLAGLARPGDVIALAGELGTGKTSFARAFIRSLPLGGGEENATDGDAAGDDEIPSPTFTLVQIYQRRPAPVWHFDLYRLERPEEAYELDLEDALTGAISLIEWPERLGPLLPPERLDVRLFFTDDGGGRRVELVGHGGWAERLGELLKDA